MIRLATSVLYLIGTINIRFHKSVCSVLVFCTKTEAVTSDNNLCSDLKLDQKYNQGC